MPMSDDAVAALRKLRDADSSMVQLAIDREKETIVLVLSEADAVAPARLHDRISSRQPRYTFYRSSPAASTTFIYTCPPASPVKDRMMHAASLRSVISTASAQAGVEVARKIEAGAPDEIEEDDLKELVVDNAATSGLTGEESSAGASASTVAGDSKAGFARPKRPGRR